MVQLRDGTILCTSYGWTLMNSDVAAKIERAFRHESTIRHGTFVFLGGYILRSSDGGKSWQGPIIPPPLEGNATRDVFGNPVPVFNRGAMCEGSDGKLYWVGEVREPTRTPSELDPSDGFCGQGRDLGISMSRGRR